MKILIYSKEGDSLFMVPRLQREGHSVCVFIKEKDHRRAYEGMTEKVNTLEDGLRTNPDVVFFDMVGDGKIADYLKRTYNVVGGGAFNDRAELDRAYGMKLMKIAGINFPETHEFNSPKEAIRFVEQNPERYVVKVDDNQSCFTSYVSDSPEDMIEMIEHMEREKLFDSKKGFVLQVFVEGIEISTAGTFDGNDFVPQSFNHTIEEKKFMTGGLGSTTGSEGSLVFFNDDPSDRLVKNLKRMTSILRANNYRGEIDLNTIVDGKGKPWALEFCSRTGYCALENELALFKGDWGEFLVSLGRGKVGDVEFSQDYCIALRVSIPPYPHMEFPPGMPKGLKDKCREALLERAKNVKIEGFEGFEESCYWLDVFVDSEGDLRCAGDDGVIGSLCATGETIEAARHGAYDMLKLLKVPNKQARIDIGRRAIKQIPELHKFGMLKNRRVK